MNRIALAVALLCVAFAGRMFAALGNSESEIAELFGKPTEQGFPNNKGITTNIYQNGDYIILVQFLRHLSLAESYTRIDKNEFSESELSALLEGSSNGRAWNKDPDKLAWERSDHKASARCETLSGRPTLMIQAH
jgi:hypothetical protein